MKFGVKNFNVYHQIIMRLSVVKLKRGFRVCKHSYAKGVGSSTYRLTTWVSIPIIGQPWEGQSQHKTP